MAKRVRRAVKFGARIAAAAKNKLESKVKLLVKSRIITKKEAKNLMKAIVSEIRAEKARIKQFAKQELRRGLKKAKPLIKKAAQRVRRLRKR